MFTQTLMFLGNDEQRAKYVPMADRLNIIGCYCQTELGHGSNVQGLETTATLDKQTDEFIIHTPHIKATKFWPGTLGRHATHATVFA
jgi:acyl-CoA oxidase